MDSNKKFKHLTREDRYVIEKNLTLNKSFCAIGKDIQKDPTQRLYQIVKTNDLGFNISIAYRYRAEGKLSVSPTKFLRLLKFKDRKKLTNMYRAL